MKLLISALCLIAFQASADIVSPISKNDELRKTSEAINQQFNDGQISTGQVRIWAGKLKHTEEFKTRGEMISEAVKGFKEAFKQVRGEDLPKNTELLIKTGNFVDGDGQNGTVAKMMKAHIEGNNYGPDKNLREDEARKMWVVLRKMPVGDDTVVAHVTTKVKDSTTGEMANVQYFLLFNPDGLAVQYFSFQGF